MHKLLFISILSLSLVTTSCSPTNKQASKPQPAPPQGAGQTHPSTVKPLTTSQAESIKDAGQSTTSRLNLLTGTPQGAEQSHPNTVKPLTTSQAESVKDAGQSTTSSLTLLTGTPQGVGQSTNPELQSDQPPLQIDLAFDQQQELIYLYSEFTTYYDNINKNRKDINQSVETIKDFQAIRASNNKQLIEAHKHLKAYMEEEKNNLDKLYLFTSPPNSKLDRMDLLRSISKDHLANPVLISAPVIDVDLIEIGQ